MVIMHEPARTAGVGTPGASGGQAARLLALGQRMDAEGLHSIALIEADDGYIVRASHPGHRQPVLIEAPHGQPPIALPPAPSPAVAPEGRPLLCRHGYATALHALGLRLDRQCATALAISEGEHFVAVCMQPAGSNAPREELFLADDLAQLIAQEQPAQPLRLRSEQAAALPEAPTQSAAMHIPADRRPSGSCTSRLHRLAARLASGVRQQTGG